MLQGLAGATESSLASNKSPTGSSSSGTAVAGISVGDLVVRGPAWNWGEDHDGGSGGYGTVVEVRGAGSHVLRFCWESVACHTRHVGSRFAGGSPPSVEYLCFLVMP